MGGAAGGGVRRESGGKIAVYRPRRTNPISADGTRPIRIFHRVFPMHRSPTSLRSRRLIRIAAPLLLCAAGACGGHPAPARSPAPLLPTAAAAGEVGIPVLTWHGFADSLTGQGGNLTETYARFEEMLRFLRDQGFRSVFPEEVRPGDDHRRLVVLTFDDGPRNHLRAAEILERYGFRGIFFVIPNRIRNGHPQHLTQDEVRRLMRGGHRVAAHGYYHRSLAGSGAEVAASLARSPGIMRAHGEPRAATADFAFPFGHYTPEVAEALAGTYRWLHTVDPGYWDGRSALLPRLLLMNDVDLSLFTDYVAGGAGNLPAWEPLFPSGGMGDSVAFLAHGTPVPADLALFAVSADAEERSYAAHPLGENVRVRGDTVWVDLRAHTRRWFPPERIAISYALVTREGGRMRYLTPGLLHWLVDPAGPPRILPPPPSQE